jgi:hypothetical protein
MFRSLSFAIIGLALAGPAAAQPYSQSMAQCAGLYEAVRTSVSRPENLASLDAAAATFVRAALAQAQAEGQGDPAGWVRQHRDAMRADWLARGELAAFSQDFRDWTAYCRALAADHGIELGLD